MEFDDILKIVAANPTNKYIFNHLDEKTQEIVVDVLGKCDASDFSEINKNADFDFTDVPVPYEKLEKESSHNRNLLSDNIGKTLDGLLENINAEEQNVEYPFLMGGIGYENNTYSHIKSFETGKSQSCSYDWDFIEKSISNCDNENERHYALLHTHPKSFGKQHDTLFNKHSEELKKLNVKADGLNLSVADLYANMYLDMLVEKYKKPIEVESFVLMHDGNLISFSTNDGIKLRTEKNLAKETSAIK